MVEAPQPQQIVSSNQFNENDDALANLLRHPRRLILIAAIIIALIVLIPMLIRYFTYGSIVVTTNQSLSTTTITMSPKPKLDSSQPNTKNAAQIKLHSGKASKVRAGTYFVTATNGLSQVTRVVVISARHTTRSGITFFPAPEAEPVATIEASSPAADATQLLYIDGTDKKLYYIDTNNNVSLVDASTTYQFVHWANINYGVGETTGGQAVAIINNQPFPIPSAQFHSTSINTVDVAPNKEIYLGVGNDVYIGSPTTGFKKLLTTQKPVTHVVASNTSVLVVTQNANTEKSKPTEATLVLYDNASKKTTTKDISSYQQVAAPSGKYFALTDDTGSTLLDNHLNEVATIPHGNFNGAFFLDDNTFYYAISNQLWKYNINDQSSTLLATTASNHAIGDIAISQDHDFIYLAYSASGLSADAGIARLGLKGQTASALALKLRPQMPLISSQCEANMINFTKPTILERPLSSDSDTSICAQVDEITLQNAGFDTSTISFNTSQLVIGTPQNAGAQNTRQ